MGDWDQNLVMSAAALLIQIRAFKLPKPELEYRFHDVRNWRADFCWPEEKLIVEFEGGVYSGGRHIRGRGFENDCIKYNTATLMGYRVLRFTTRHVNQGTAIQMVREALGHA